MQEEEEYTFVTIDNESDFSSDDIVVDVEYDTDLADFVTLDDESLSGDCISIADDTVMLSDTDMYDVYATDIDGTDISFIL